MATVEFTVLYSCLEELAALTPECFEQPTASLGLATLQTAFTTVCGQKSQKSSNHAALVSQISVYLWSNSQPLRYLFLLRLQISVPPFSNHQFLSVQSKYYLFNPPSSSHSSCPVAAFVLLSAHVSLSFPACLNSANYSFLCAWVHSNNYVSDHITPYFYSGHKRKTVPKTRRCMNIFVE